MKMKLLDFFKNVCHWGNIWRITHAPPPLRPLVIVLHEPANVLKANQEN